MNKSKEESLVKSFGVSSGGSEHQRSAGRGAKAGPCRSSSSDHRSLVVSSLAAMGYKATADKHADKAKSTNVDKPKFSKLKETCTRTCPYIFGRCEGDATTEWQ